MTTAARPAAWQATLGALGDRVQGIAELRQAMRIVLMTPIGSDPHRPDFGCDLWRRLDLPITTARPSITRDVVDALAEWEPRITVKSVIVTAGDAAGTFAVDVPWTPVGDTDEFTFLLQLPSGDLAP